MDRWNDGRLTLYRKRHGQSLGTLSAVALGTYLPFSPLAGVLGFTPLPAAYFDFVAVATTFFVGLAIGIDLLFDGAALIGFAGAIHSLPKTEDRPASKAA